MFFEIGSLFHVPPMCSMLSHYRNDVPNIGAVASGCGHACSVAIVTKILHLICFACYSLMYLGHALRDHRLSLLYPIH